MITVYPLISIHRLLAEPDPGNDCGYVSGTEFQSTGSSRSPTEFEYFCAALLKFQSTGSSRSPTTNRLDFRAAEIISIHRLLAEPDSFAAILGNGYGISIHRLLAEPDPYAPCL